LNPIKVYDSRYNLMDMWLTTESLPDGSTKLTLRQNLAVVFDLLRWHDNADWSLTHLFDRKIEKLCPLSRGLAEILHRYDEKEVDLADEWTEMVRLGGDDAVKSGDEHNNKDDDVSEQIFVKYRDGHLLDRDIGIEMKEHGVEKIKSIPPGSLPSSELLLTRRITGSGQEKGTLLTRVVNVSQRAIKVTLLEVLPWYMRLYLHTLRVIVDGNSAADLERLLYSPAVDRVKPGQIEWEFTLNAGSELAVEFDFDMTLLRYSEYPLDPARGFDINGAILSYETVEGLHQHLVSNALLLTLPTPDFTMPFNVIMLTSLAMTFFYGYFFNLIFRRFYLPDPANPRGLAAKLGMLFKTRILKQKIE